MKKHLPLRFLMVLGVPLMVFAGLFITACPDPPTIKNNTNGFYAINTNTQKYYPVDAKKVYEGKKCVIWVEKSSAVTEEQAQQIAVEYDDRVLDLILDNFGIEPFTFLNTHFDNVMELASWMVSKNRNKNEKFTILLLDIKDSYKEEGDPYVAGYFTPLNYFGDRYSSLRNMIYLDTNPGLKELDQMFETLAHELQHLASFMAALANRSVIQGNTLVGLGQLDTGIDEGMSTMAEHLYWLGRERPDEPRYRWFVQDPAGTIAKGNNFYVWGNVPGDSVLDEYATAYMFFQWLYIQSGDTDLFKKINNSTHGDYQVLTEVAKETYLGWSNWETLLGDWFAANYIWAANGRYGYMDKFKGAFEVEKDGEVIAYKSPRTPLRSVNNGYTTLDLLPGEGVYSKINLSYNIPTGSGANVRYIDLSKGSTPITSPGTFGGEALLAFNANTDKNKNTDTGKESPTAEKVYLTGKPFDWQKDELPVQGSWVLSRGLQLPQSFPRPLAIDINVAIDWQKGLPLIEPNDQE